MQAGKIAFSVAALLMALFTADVIAGAFFRAAFLSDVAAASMLAISCSFFVVGLLVNEAKAKRGETSFANGEEETR